MWTPRLTVENFCRLENLGDRYTDSGGDFSEVIRRSVARAPRRRSLSVAQKGYTLVIDANHTEITKRQDQGEWINLVSQNGVTKPGVRHRINTIELSPDIEITWTEGSSYSISVGATAGVSVGLFEIFSASMEIATTYEESYSASISLTTDSGNCPQNVNIYYAPHFTRYEGLWSNDQENTVEIWVAQNVNAELEGRFIIECVSTTPPK
ncbi:hypothetical protein FHETE_541 [Fusarium heterosporum]|uniref:Uncharacterized protein n=1 Tax=Fusarium heterosporum TaxID=42747 RepID=A0A8H5X3R1_FUSHE|nr:hypothetical protein FHETE_541 [Fusarium heterosporum]